MQELSGPALPMTAILAAIKWLGAEAALLQGEKHLPPSAQSVPSHTRPDPGPAARLNKLQSRRGARCAAA